MKILKLNRVIKGSYWWDKAGQVVLDPESIESMDDLFDYSPSGSRSRCATRIVMTSGAEHKVYEEQDEILKKWASLDG